MIQGTTASQKFSNNLFRGAFFFLNQTILLNKFHAKQEQSREPGRSSALGNGFLDGNLSERQLCFVLNLIFLMVKVLLKIFTHVLVLSERLCLSSYCYG